MEFRRLIGFIIVSSIFISCGYNGSDLFYYKYCKIGTEESIDSLILISNNKDGSKLFINNGNSFIDQSNFSIFEDSSRLVFETSKCSVNVLLKVGTISINECGPIHPFLGEWITHLDSKTININRKTYRVYKLSNESGQSQLNSSGVFWLQDFGIIFINLIDGHYLELVEANDELIPWREVLRVMKADRNFCELWEIPAPPPPPPLGDTTN